MEAQPHAHRFQQLQLLHDGRAARLELVRDIVEDRRCWLLRAHRPAGRFAEVALWFRMRGGWGEAAHPVGRGILDLVDEDGTALVVLDPLPGEPFLAALARCSSSDAIEALEALSSCLQDALDRGCPAGALDRGALWWDGKKPRILPSAWLIPCTPTLAERPWSDQFDPQACAQEIEALWSDVLTFCRDGMADGAFPWSAELIDRVRAIAPRVRAASRDEDIPPEVREAVARSKESGHCLVVRSRTPRTVATRIARWLRDEGSCVVDLGPHMRMEDDASLSFGPSQVLICHDARRYADFGIAIDRLRRRNWIDGNERTIMVSSTGIDEEGLQLAMAMRDAGEGPDSIEWPASGEPQRSLNPTADAAGRVLEVLSVLGGVIAADWLSAAFSWTPRILADALWSLVERDQVRVTYGWHHAGPGLQLLVECSETIRVELDEIRRAEIASLLASVAEQHPFRGRNLGPQWLYADLLGRTNPSAAVRRMRSLAQRADRAGLGLMAASVYGALLELGEQNGVSRDDHCHAAIVRSAQHRRAGRLEEAHRVLTAVFDRYLEEDAVGAEAIPSALLSEVVLSLAQLEMHRSNFISAERRLSKLLDRTQGELPAEQRARVYLELAWVQLQLGRTRESCRTSELVLRILDAHAWPALVARAHNQLGFALYKESDYSGSVVHYERALRLREQIGDELAVARTHNNLGLSYRALGQLGEAERSLRESLRLKRVAGDELSVAASLLNLGFVLLDRGRMSVAEESANRCLEIARHHSHPETEAEAYGLLGEIALAGGRLGEARHLLQRDLSICEATGHDSERLATLRRLAEVLLRLGQEEDAARHLEDARSLLGQQPSRFEASLLDRLEGELLRRSGAIEPAIEAYSAAARGFAEVHRHQAQLESLALRGAIEFEADRTDSARATLAEVRDLLARHEIHPLPVEVEALEQMLSDSTTRNRAAGPHTCLESLTEMLLARLDSPTPVEDVLLSLRRTLSIGEVVFLLADGTCWRASGEVCQASTPPAEVLDLAESGSLHSSRRVGDWWVIGGVGGVAPRLAVKTSRTLQPAEEQLFRGALRVLSCGALPARTPGSATTPLEATGNGSRADSGMVGRSPALVQVERTVERVADTGVSVLLLGENGTGKELVARALHEGARSRNGDFVAVNCASIPANLLESELFGHERGSFTSAYEQRIGRFEQAAGGTLLLDEIGEMPLDMQAKLLRVLQERTFTRVGGSESLEADARIVASTNRDLLTEVRRGRFRMDLFYRINVVTIEIPPLRQRREDIEVLARHFLAKHAAQFGDRVRDISSEALRTLESYEWPGNVRELENVITNALVFAGSEVLRPEDLPSSVSGRVSRAGEVQLEDAVRQLLETEDWSEERPLLPRLETWVVKEMVERVGNKTKAARLLGITKPTVYERLRRFEALYGLSDDRERGSDDESDL